MSSFRHRPALVRVSIDLVLWDLRRRRALYSQLLTLVSDPRWPRHCICPPVSFGFYVQVSQDRDSSTSSSSRDPVLSTNTSNPQQGSPHSSDCKFGESTDNIACRAHTEQQGLLSRLYHVRHLGGTWEDMGMGPLKMLVLIARPE